MQSLKPSAGVNAERSKELWNGIYDETPGLAWVRLTYSPWRRGGFDPIPKMRGAVMRNNGTDGFADASLTRGLEERLNDR